MSIDLLPKVKKWVEVVLFYSSDLDSDSDMTNFRIAVTDDDIPYNVPKELERMDRAVGKQTSNTICERYAGDVSDDEELVVCDGTTGWHTGRYVWIFLPPRPHDDDDDDDDQSAILKLCEVMVFAERKS